MYVNCAYIPPQPTVPRIGMSYDFVHNCYPCLFKAFGWDKSEARVNRIMMLACFPFYQMYGKDGICIELWRSWNPLCDHKRLYFKHFFLSSPGYTKEYKFCSFRQRHGTFVRLHLAVISTVAGNLTFIWNDYIVTV